MRGKFGKEEEPGNIVTFIFDLSQKKGREDTTWKT
jgi:hypothetical protein